MNDAVHTKTVKKVNRPQNVQVKQTCQEKEELILANWQMFGFYKSEEFLNFQ